MSTYVIKVPDIGEGIAEVELVHWHVKPGDVIREEQALADVMTDKANVEIPSPVAGKVIAIAGKPGDVIAVGSELIRLEVEGKGNVADAAEVKARPEAPRETKTAAAPILRSVPSSPPPPARTAPSRPAPTPTSSERALASPAVRRRARELELDLDEIAGSGPEGRITQEDLDAHLRRTPRGASFSAPLRYNVPPGGRVDSGVQRNDTEVVQVIGLRRKIAEKMQESKRRIPHFTYVEEIDVTAVEELRAQLNTRWRSERGHLTMLPFLMRAIARALPEFPEVNARYDDEKGTLTRFGAVHIGIATQTGNGLIVPVVRNAEARDLWSCASEVARLAEAARAGKATREELTGSTVTITSLGPLGGIVTTPVINHPEVAIVGVNRIVERPVVRDGAVVVRQVMNLSSSFDHRIVDGLRAAMFVQRLRALLEVPATLFID
jgi:2-oxoisovalerate dehydrogenase E2 component (dihydrolipoyl transacylase)